MAILAFFVSLIFFLISVPFRSLLFVVRANIRVLELKNKKNKPTEKQGDRKKGIIKKPKIMSKSSKTDKLSKLDRLRYLALKGLKRALQFLISLLRLLGSSTIVGGIVLSFIAIAVTAAMVSSMIGLETIIFNKDNTKKTVSAQSIAEANKKSKDNKSSKDADVDGWLQACQDVWTHGREAGWDYSQGHGVKWGKYSTGHIDCSGYVSLCLQKAGYIKAGVDSNSSNFPSLLRGSKYWSVTKVTDKNYKLKKGDIVIVAGSHVQIYAGDNKWYNNGTKGSSFPDRKGAYVQNSSWKKDTYGNWHNSGMKNCYCGRLIGSKNSSSGVTSGSVKDLKYPPEGKGWAVPIFYQSSTTLKDKRSMSDGHAYSTTSLGKFGGKTKTLSSSGCWEVASAMAASYMANKDINPRYLLEKYLGGIGSVNHRYYEGSGGYGDAVTAKIVTIEGIGKKWERKYLGSDSSNKLLKYLKKGGIAVCSMRTGWAMGSGHYIVIRGTDGKGNVYVNDPHYNNCFKAKLTGTFKGDKPKTENEHLNYAYDYDEQIKPFYNNGCWVFIPKGGK